MSMIQRFLRLFSKRRNGVIVRPPTPYPMLAYLADAYFHQDADLFGDTNDAIFREWASVENAGRRADMAAEIDAFLAAHPAAPLTAFNTLFEPGMWLAEDDAELVATLKSLRQIALADTFQTPPG